MVDEARNIEIFDTTLRDGEQAPGATMLISDKIKIASKLDEMKVGVIEAGFPAASAGDFKAVNEISKNSKTSIIAALSRSKRADIELAAEAIAPAQRRRIHTFISTSPIHMKYKLKMEPDDVLSAITDSVTLARNLSDDVEWSCEDGTRSDIEFLKRCFDRAMKAGATTVNIADTVGYILPFEFSALIKEIRSSVENIEKAVFSVHCHNDLGMAVANSIAAIESGARQVECTMNGIGERAGNASLEEIVMLLKTRADKLPYRTDIVTEHLTGVSKMVADATGFNVQRNKAIVGENAFAHESGIHQHGMIVNSTTYEIMDPNAVGAPGSQIIMGKHSGKHALKKILTDRGFNLTEPQIDRLMVEFKEYADHNKSVSEKYIFEIIDRII